MLKNVLIIESHAFYTVFQGMKFFLQKKKFKAKSAFFLDDINEKRDIMVAFLVFVRKYVGLS